MLKNIEIDESDPQRLVISVKRSSFAFGTIFSLIFCIHWFGLLVYNAQASSFATDSFLWNIVHYIREEPLWLIGLIFVLIVFRRISHDFRILHFGEKFTFDRTQEALFRQDKRLGGFARIVSVEMRLASRSDDVSYYDLLLVLDGGEPIKICRDGVYEELCVAARKIRAACGARVKISED